MKKILLAVIGVVLLACSGCATWEVTPNSLLPVGDSIFSSPWIGWGYYLSADPPCDMLVYPENYHTQYDDCPNGCMGGSSAWDFMAPMTIAQWQKFGWFTFGGSSVYSWTEGGTFVARDDSATYGPGTPKFCSADGVTWDTPRVQCKRDSECGPGECINRLCCSDNASSCTQDPVVYCNEDADCTGAAACQGWLPADYNATPAAWSNLFYAFEYYKPEWVVLSIGYNDLLVHHDHYATIEAAADAQVDLVHYLQGRRAGHTDHGSPQTKIIIITEPPTVKTYGGFTHDMDADYITLKAFLRAKTIGLPNVYFYDLHAALIAEFGSTAAFAHHCDCPAGRPGCLYSDLIHQAPFRKTLCQKQIYYKYVRPAITSFILTSRHMRIMNAAQYR